MIKTISLAHRKPGLSREEFNKYWEGTHGPLAAKMIPNVKRYVQNHFVTVPGMEYTGDGIVEMWYDDIESWQKSRDFVMSSKELKEDGGKFCGPGGQFWVVEEHVILDNLTKK